MNTDVKERPKSKEVAPLQPVARLSPSRLPITPELASRFQVSPDEWRVLVEQTFPAARSVEAVGMALAYCRHRNLDIFKKPVHIVPVYSSALKKMVETVWPGISELRTTASRTGQYAGLTEAEFGPVVEREFIQKIEREDRSEGEVRHNVQFPEWCRMTAYKMIGGVKCAFTARIFWTEIYATAGRFTDMPNEMWRKRPHGQLDKCCEAAVLRKAFPEELGNEYAAEEMQGRILDDDTVPVAQIEERQKPRPPQAKPQQQPQPKPQQDEQVDRNENVVEGEVVEDDDIFPGDLPFPSEKEKEQHEADTVKDFMDRLDKALAGATSESEIDAIFEESDALARYDGDIGRQQAALDLKRKHMKRLFT